MKRKHSGEYVGAIVMNLIFGWFAMRLPEWWPNLVTPGYTAVLWVILIAVAAQVLGNLIWLVNDEPWSKALVDAFIQAASLASSATLYYVMPFNFDFFAASQSISMIFHWAILISVIVSAVLLAIRLVQIAVLLLSFGTKQVGHL